MKFPKTGHILMDRRGEPWRSGVDAVQVYFTKEAAARVQRAWNSMEIFNQFTPFSVVPVTVGKGKRQVT